MSQRLNAIDVISASYDNLSDTEKRIADFILQNVSDVARLSVRDIATQSQTSSASVSRFVRHVGYDSLSELRLAIASSVGTPSEALGTRVTEVSLDNVGASIDYILENKIQELRASAAQLKSHPDDVNRAVNLIADSDNILFAAVGNSIPVCSNLAFRLGQIGYRAHCPLNTESMILESLSLRRNDVVIVVSASGYSRRLETIIDNAEDSGAPVILFTTNAGAILSTRAAVTFVASEHGERLSDPQGPQFASHVPEDFLVETFFSFILAQGKNIRERVSMERKSLGRDKEATPTLN